MSIYLGTPTNWLSILEDEGVLALMNQHLTLWKNKMLFKNPRIEHTGHQGALDFLVDVSRLMRISWADFCKELPWRMGESVLRRVGANPTGNFAALVIRLSDYVKLTTDFNTWVSACSIVGRGNVYRTAEQSTQIWLNTMKNCHPERLRIVGAVLNANQSETTAILATIHEMGCADLFGLTSSAPAALSIDAMDISPAEDYNWKSFLRSKLSEAYASSLRSNEAKDNHIESVLQNPTINTYIGSRVRWLLPPNTTLWDLLTHNNGSPWASLVAVLVEIAERATGKIETTFPIANTRTALSRAVDECMHSVPFLEIVFYSPNMLPADRKAQWRAVADSVMSQAELITWLGLPKEMATERLSPKQMNDHFEALSILLDTKQQLRHTVIALMNQRSPDWKFARFQDIEASIFATNAPAPQLAIPAEVPFSWPGGREFLAKLKINNDTLAAELDECEACKFFGLRPKDEWPAQLTAMGAVGMQNLKVYNALFQASLIK